MKTSELWAVTSTLLADVGAVAMHSRIRPLTPGTRMVGRALTIQVPIGDNLAIHAALAIAKPGDLLVVDGGGYTERALMGGIMMTQAKAAGLAGVVIDGAMRDTQELQDLGLGAFAAGVHPAGPFKIGPGTVHGTIQCGGAVVHDGDWIVADDDGVVVVPSQRLDALLSAALAKQKREAERITAIASGQLRPQWLDAALAAAKVEILPCEKPEVI